MKIDARLTMTEYISAFEKKEAELNEKISLLTKERDNALEKARLAEEVLWNIVSEAQKIIDME